jgi:hypothetical protein
LRGSQIPDLSLVALLAGPSAVPLLASTAEFYSSRRKRNLVGKISIAVLAYCASLWLTSHAYHIRNAYRALPSVDDFLLVGLGWALVATVPSLIAIFIRKSDLPSALLTGAVASFLSFVLLAPLNFGLIMMLSFE